MDSEPLWRATAWKTNAPMRAAPPKSQSGLLTRYQTNRQPFDSSESLVLATCWVITFTAFDRAARSANSKLIWKCY